jgi:hypothetical protein
MENTKESNLRGSELSLAKKEFARALPTDLESFEAKPPAIKGFTARRLRYSLTSPSYS